MKEQQQQLARHLRQMIALLERERQALAGLDLDAMVASQHDKEKLCDCIDLIVSGDNGDHPNEECRALAQSAQRLNEVNRTVRNLMAANISARLDALTGRPATYQIGTRRLRQA